MNRSVIPEIVATIDRHFDRTTADRFEAIPRDPRADAIHWRVRRSQPEVSTWGDIDAAIWRAVREHDPAAVVVELPNRADEGGTTLSGPWWAATFAACDAAVAYLWPELLTPDERQIMVDRWEAIFGPPHGA